MTTLPEAVHHLAAGPRTDLAILALHALLFLGALVSVLGSPLTGGMKLVWVVVTFAAPVLGPLVWFVFGRRDAYRRMPAYWG